MRFTNSLSQVEYIFIGAFILLYTIYVIKYFLAAKALSLPYYKIIFKLLLRSVYFTLFLLAIMAPSFGDSKREVKAVGKDIFIAVDLSESMNAFDIAPTRLEKMKFELKNITNALRSDRVGLIIFSSEAFMQCPLTYDQSALNLFIETLGTSLVPRKGTDFGPPLDIALKKFKHENEGNQNKSQIIILISDGEDFGEDTEGIVKEIAKTGIKLFTLGIGSEKGSKVRAANGYVRDRKGNEVITKLEPAALKKIASDANGKYYEISDKRNDVPRLIADVEAIEGEIKEAFTMDITANKYYLFLMIGLVLMLLDFVTPYRVIKI